MDTERAPKISICVPTHDMKNGEFFIKRLLDSLDMQTFRDFEIVITKDGKMAENTNSALKKAKGELVKILYMDDYLALPSSLQDIVDAIKDEKWLVTGCVHDRGDGVRFNPHIARYGYGMQFGENTIGSPSVLTMRRDSMMLFDEGMTWLLDADLYKRLFNAYGYPVYLDSFNVVMGIGDHQMTNLIGDDVKREETEYINKKYE